MGNLQSGAARDWSLEQTVRAFRVTSSTIVSWIKSLEEEGASALVQLPEPVNRFPDYVPYIVQQLEPSCPALGR